MRRIGLICFVAMVSGMAVPRLQAMPVGFGAKAGIAMSKVAYSGTAEGGIDLVSGIEDMIKSRTGLAGGVFVSMGLSPLLALQPEMLLVQKGWSMEADLEVVGEGGDGDTITTKDDYKVTYLEFPILLKGILPLKGPVKPALFLGPVVAFKVAADGRMWLDGEEITGVDIGADETVDRIVGSDLGLVFGAEVAVGHFLIDARYDLGFSDLIENTEGAGDIKTKNRTILIMAGYRI